MFAFGGIRFTQSIISADRHGYIAAAITAVLTGLLWLLPVRPVSAIDLQVTNADLPALVRSIARSEGMDLMGSEKLQGTVSVTLHGVDAKEALRRIGDQQHFIIREEEGLLMIETDGADSGKGSKNLKPFIIEPEHLRPDRLREVLASVLPEDRMRVLKETNQLVLYATPGEQRAAEAVLSRVDRPPQQVQLSVTVLAMQDSYLKETGIAWSWLGFTGHKEDSTGTYGAIRFGKAPGGEAYRFFYRPELKAMESTGKVVLVARPSMMTVNGEEGRILIGDRVPVLVERRENGESTTSVRYEEAGIRLAYTPYITKDGYIDAEVAAEVSTPALVSEMKAYRITTREARTRVRLKNGEVLVIGGLMDNRQEKQIQKIPLLGDIPLLGKLFRYARKSKDKVELFILVKADIVDEKMLDQHIAAAPAGSATATSAAPLEINAHTSAAAKPSQYDIINSV